MNKQRKNHKQPLLENENSEIWDYFHLRKKPICVLDKLELKEKQRQEWAGIF